MFAYDFGVRAVPPCGDCDERGRCTMNCGPAVPPKEASVPETMKDVTPKKDKERVRVAAGREGGIIPKAVSGAIAIHNPDTFEKPNLAIMLMQVAKDKDVDADKARAMFDLYKDVMAHDAKVAFTKAFIKLQKKLPTIDRDGKIAHADTKGDGKARQKSTYSTYPNLMKVIKPLLDANGFGLGSWLEPGEGGKMDVVTQLDHEEGHFRVSRFPVQAETSGSKNNMQGWGSSESYGMRYNAIALLNIVSKAPGDRDLDGRPNDPSLKDGVDGEIVEVSSPTTISKAQVEEMLIHMRECGVSESNFRAHYGIDNVADLPLELFVAAKKALADHAAKRARGG